MGGEKLKLPLLAALFLVAGLLVQTQIISAQDASGNPLTEEDMPIARDPRAGEENLSLDAEAQTAIPSSQPSTWTVIRMILILALAAAAIYGFVFFLKRTSKQSARKDPFLKILASTHLGANRYAHIVSVGSKAWLLGSSDGGVNLIGEIDDKEIINAMLLEDSQKPAEGAVGRLPDFLGMIRRMGVSAKSGIPGADDIRKRRERLKGL